MGVGIWVKVDPTVTDYVGLTVDQGSYEAATILLIVVGAFILLVGFLGCCGACKESSCMLCLFAGLMIVIVLLQIVAAILAVVFQSEVEQGLNDHLASEMYTKMTDDEEDPFTAAVNGVQMEFNCCGAKDYNDYGVGSKIYNTTATEDPVFEGYYVPKTCCVEAKKNSDGTFELSDQDWLECSNDAKNTNADSDILKLTGCYDSLVDWLKAHAVIVIGIGFGLAVIEILGIVFACCVRGKINDGDNYN